MVDWETDWFSMTQMDNGKYIIIYDTGNDYQIIFSYDLENWTEPQTIFPDNKLLRPYILTLPNGTLCYEI